MGDPCVGEGGFVGDGLVQAVPELGRLGFHDPGAGAGGAPFLGVGVARFLGGPGFGLGHREALPAAVSCALRASASR